MTVVSNHQVDTSAKGGERGADPGGGGRGAVVGSGGFSVG